MRIGVSGYGTRVREKVLNIPLEHIISGMVFPGNQLHYYWQRKIKLTQKYEDTQDTKNTKYTHKN